MALKHARPCLPSIASGICVHLRERGRSPSRTNSAGTGRPGCQLQGQARVPAPPHRRATSVDRRAVPPSGPVTLDLSRLPVCPDSLSRPGHRHWTRAPDPARPHLPASHPPRPSFLTRPPLQAAGCRLPCLWGTRFSPQQPPLPWAPLGPGVPSLSLGFPRKAEGSRPWRLSELPGALSPARFPAQPGSPPASALSEHPSLRAEVKP
uniref:Uncharacterized protein n=1 Tax=Myotis myotis TaxID=51298 RepID=A0A7J7XH09_MYOMY|nr:hypothetical protein mMyoMyo1_011583 [Myotis myotis]